MGTKHGKYSTDDLGHDGSGPIKVTEMDKRRTKNFTCDDGVSFADVVDETERRSGHHLRVREVEADAFGERTALPATVCPRGVATVPRPESNRREQLRFDI